MTKEKAVVDRFEGQLAVLLVGESERKVIVKRDALPEGTKEGQWLQVEMAGDKVTSVTIDEEETAAVKQRIADKLAALRR